MSNLDSIGFDDWFKNRVDDKTAAAHDIARVVAVHKDSYTITSGEGNILAELTGNLLFSADSPLELPTTGDWVYADFYDDDTHAIIVGVLPRKSTLKRKSAGKSVDFQLIAANIDIAFIIQSLNENFNLRRLERYLVMVNEGGIKPVILLSKCDLVSSQTIDETRSRVRSIAPLADVMVLSNMISETVDALAGTLESGLTYCLLGSSGVGKTSLLNRLIGSEQFETRTVSKLQSKGRHTTTSRHLLLLESGAMIVDTPGMRELGSMAVDDGLDQTFGEITALSQSCRFSNCSHRNEKGCAITTAISTGELSEQRYQNYLKMKKEAEFNQMSYLDKKRKDKNFGKLIKTTMKNKQR